MSHTYNTADSMEQFKEISHRVQQIKKARAFKLLCANDTAIIVKQMR